MSIIERFAQGDIGLLVNLLPSSLMRQTIMILVSLFIALQIGTSFAVLPLERAPLDSARLVNAFGTPLGNNINTNQQVQVTANITNMQEEDQEFVYIVQIKDEFGRIMYLAFITGVLSPGQTFSPALSWIAEKPGTYTAEIYVWDSFSGQEALSESEEIIITVS